MTADTEKSPHIAVIMPAYNAEKYLRAAVESIRRQTYQNFTLLVLNDGSTDGTEALLKELSAEDPRIRFLTLPNGGPARARNAGLDAFLTEQAGSRALPNPDYIMFCDADDEYLPDAFERAAALAAKGAELVFLGFTIVNPDRTENDYCEPDAEYSPGDLGPVFPKLYKANLLNQVWGKLFSAELLRRGGFRFPDYRWGEDRLFIYDCLEEAKKIAVTSYCGYLYKMYNSASLISGYYDRKPEVCKISDGRVQELCRHFRVTDDSACRYMFMKSVFSCLTNLYSPTCRLSAEEKRNYAAGILKDEAIRERVRNVGGGTAAKLLSRLILSGSVALNLAAAKAAAKLSSGAPLVFQKIKHRK